MLTPPLHFAIACAPPQHSPSTSSQILYRGAVPIRRNLEFVDRLQLKTILVISKKEPKADADVVQWANGQGWDLTGKGKGKCRQVEIKWIKAGKMEGEELGMGRAEVNDALKVVLQPSNYPLYIADAEGLTHSSLVIGALRKLMGWHQDSILNELFKFDADDEDLPFGAFFSSYLSPTPTDGSDSKAESATLQMPEPPYPCWLWPATTAAPAALQPPKGRSRSTSISMPEKPAPVPDSTKQAEVFPNPLAVRRHPTMRLVFPAAQPEAPPISPKKTRRVSFHASPVPSPTLAAVAAADMAAGQPVTSGLRNTEADGNALLLDGQGSPTASRIAVVETESPESEGQEEEYEEEEYEEDEDEDEEEEDDEEDDDDDDKAAPSQLISALDLEGF